MVHRSPARTWRLIWLAVVGGRLDISAHHDGPQVRKAVDDHHGRFHDDETTEGQHVQKYRLRAFWWPQNSLVYQGKRSRIDDDIAVPVSTWHGAMMKRRSRRAARRR
jgi:hypothetical protein